MLRAQWAAWSVWENQVTSSPSYVEPWKVLSGVLLIQFAWRSAAMDRARIPVTWQLATIVPLYQKHLVKNLTVSLTVA